MAPERYFAVQGRFRPLLEDEGRLAEVKGSVEGQWETLVRRHRRPHGDVALSGP